MTKILTIFAAMFIFAAKAEAFECKNTVDSLARLAYYEARGEGKHGMRLVVEVALNRKNHSRFPDTICGVIKQRGQFPWVGKKKTPPKGDTWEAAKEVARRALAEGSIHTDALYFRSGGGSSWMNKPRKMKYKSHSFY